MTEQINNETYWENRFKGNSKLSIGSKQTAFFGDIALKNFPEWFINDIKDNDSSICDVGCAEGEITGLFSKYFTNSQITGIDFSSNAIDNARKKFPHIEFICGKFEYLDREYDVIF
jgi:2-polyprenyl-3-methyl-5-hydroxy-6-metoxy-1,4-benzoquinol methylase